MDLAQPGREKPLKFVSSAALDSSQDQNLDLLSVAFTRVQKSSPEFVSSFDGIDQSIDIKISTFIFRASPEPIISLYDFLMATFVSQSKLPTNADEGSRLLDNGEVVINPRQEAEERIRVLVKLASVQRESLTSCVYSELIFSLVILVDGIDHLATLSLSTADVAVLLRPRALRVTGRLGSLALSNDKPAYAIREEFNQIMSIEGQNFAEFRYQTFNPDEEAYTGIKSSVYLKAASVKLHFLEEPLRAIFMFFVKLAKLKVAVQRASEIERMQFELSVKSPILVFPSRPTHSRDVLVMRLGEIAARNTSEATVNRIAASLRGIQLVSMLYKHGQLAVLKIIDDVDVTADIVQTNGINRGLDNDHPDNQVHFSQPILCSSLMIIADCRQVFRCSVASH